MARGGGERKTEKQNCPMWNHRSSAPPGPLPKKRGNLGVETQRERTAPSPGQSTQHKPLKIMYTNARSIVNKIQELKLLAADCSPDVIAITESWTHSAILKQYLSIPNYSIVARHDQSV